MNTVITTTIADFILKNHLKMSSGQIAKRFNISKTSVRYFYQKNNIKVPREIVIKFRANAMKKPYSKEEHNYIKNNIEHKSIKQIAKELNRSSCTLRLEAHKIGLSDIIEQKKANSCFKPGHVPFNIGKKQHEYMSPEAIERSKISRFKKGIIPANSKEDYAEVIRKDSNGKKYIMKKYPDKRKLIFKHRYLWEKTHGSIPKGFNVVFKDGNTLNCVIENLECISNQELMTRNSFLNLPEDIQEIIHLKASITRQINKHERTN